MDWEVSRTGPNPGMEDVHARPDGRRLAIDAVGIRGLRHPVDVDDGERVQHSVATVRLAVELPAERRGVHMSRFVALLMERRAALSPASLRDFLGRMAARLEAHSAEAEFRFPIFLKKHAPVSGVASYSDYEVALSGRLAGGRASIWTEISVPVTSLCPCSREISDYGAHNQRSHIRIGVQMRGGIAFRELVAIAESRASAPVYGLLKRPDEKALTERAYDNPKFVEDTVRDVALALRNDSRIECWRVEAENFESIHNHSAYAALAGGG